MNRLTTSNVVPRIAESASLSGKKVLEVGCGKGFRTAELLRYCSSLVAIDPDKGAIAWATTGKWPETVAFQVGSITDPMFPKASFDVVIFTLSLHHIPEAHMGLAIHNAVSVLKPEGKIVFLEPGSEGSLLEAELLFGAGDGDERTQRNFAYEVMTTHPRLSFRKEFYEEERFRYPNIRLFREHLTPKLGGIEEWLRFLVKHNLELTAKRRVDIFGVK
ncbi:MAG: class I SAM-dependent methyltransferase [bacterium]|nr:class I SAM-dependent methyltransferase [bacterium]